MDKQKLQEIFSDKAYVESIAKMSAEDAAKSLCEKGVEVTADDLMKVHEFVLAHKEELQNGELSEDALASVAGGMSDKTSRIIGLTVGVGLSAGSIITVITCMALAIW